ncbi:MAG: GTPase Era [Fibrobacteres bacterium]|nr:GTPase Era [Fibrobacterota bacterium]
MDKSEKTKGAAVAIIGSPNAGKSTLLNKILGKKISIVTDKPQTTEERILGINTEGNCQILFYDTPGIGKPIGERAARINRVAEHAAHEMDFLLFIIDTVKGFGENDRGILKNVAKLEKPIIVVLNKMDLSNNMKAVPIVEEISKAVKVAEFVPISAKTGDNVDKLLEVIRQYAPENPFLYDEDELTNLDDNFAAAEFIREQIYINSDNEIPYRTIVKIDTMEDAEDGSLNISAEIVADNERHRKMLIGHEGSFIKKVRLYARKRLKEYFERPVALELFVKAKKGGVDKKRRKR